MAKQKTVFTCQSCGFQSPKWLGKCSSCGTWNSFVEEISIPQGRIDLAAGTSSKVKPLNLAEIQSGDEDRLETQDPELNRVLGGGIVSGSLVLLGGEPGIGKSTLLLQMAMCLSQPVWYISGEESGHQIRMRASRLEGRLENVILYTETECSRLLHTLKEHQPSVVIIDSIQTMYANDIESAPGSVSQIRHCTALLMRLAKEQNIALFMVGHITKDGTLAGPKVLEHMVDTVLQFEGDRHHTYRILRTLKNRFGSTSELGLYEMKQEGMRPVTNPSEMLLSPAYLQQSGTAVCATLEGNRPLLIEVQVLATRATFGTPQRSATGFDIKRLHMLIAVLEKRIGIPLGNMDVFLNVTGGLKVDDPAVDLAVCMALVSSYYDKPIPLKHCFAAEVGLGGELRPVSRLSVRRNEAERLGFKKVIAIEDFKETNVIPVQLDVLVRQMFGVE